MTPTNRAMRRGAGGRSVRPREAVTRISMSTSLFLVSYGCFYLGAFASLNPVLIVAIAIFGIFWARKFKFEISQRWLMVMFVGQIFFAIPLVLYDLFRIPCPGIVCVPGLLLQVSGTVGAFACLPDYQRKSNP